MSNELTAVQERVFDLFGACATDPDDEATGRTADEALRRLDALLADDRED